MKFELQADNLDIIVRTVRKDSIIYFHYIIEKNFGFVPEDFSVNDLIQKYGSISESPENELDMFIECYDIFQSITPIILINHPAAHCEYSLTKAGYESMIKKYSRIISLKYFTTMYSKKLVDVKFDGGIMDFVFEPTPEFYIIYGYPRPR